MARQAVADSDAQHCRVLAARFVPPGLHLSTVSPAQPASEAILRKVGRTAHDAGYEWRWYYVLVHASAGPDLKATVPLICARNIFGAYAVVNVETGGEIVLP